MDAAVVVVLVLLAIGGIFYFSYYLKKKRREELARVASQLGLRYSQDDLFDLLSLPFALLSRGEGRGVENVLSGTWQGIDLKEFDYWYYEETRDSKGNRSRTYHRFSCVVTELPVASPGLSISKENIFTRMADGLGFRDIDFELEEFNRAFQVKGEDRKFANDLIDSRMMRWLLSAGRGWGFDLSGPYLMCSCKKRRPAELVSLLETLRAFRENIPRVVWSLYGPGERQDQRPSGS
jgi:hypothetical protein